MISDEEFMEEGAAESVVFEKADSNADSDSDSSSEEEKPLKVHLDKWLWAARFYKTLPLARKAIQSGKIYYNGHRSRSTVEISVGGLLKIQHGNVNRLVIILGLSTRRRSMKDAAALYQDISQHQETLSQGGIAASAQPPRYSQPSSSAYPGSHSGYGHGQSTVKAKEAMGTARVMANNPGNFAAPINVRLTQRQMLTTIIENRIFMRLGGPVCLKSNSRKNPSGSFVFCVGRFKGQAQRPL